MTVVYQIISTAQVIVQLQQPAPLNQAVSMLENVTLDIRAEQSTYSEWYWLTDYSDLILRAVLQANW